MMNVARLKEKARALELKEQWREALELYTRVVEESAPNVLDISLWNRIGDLHLRTGHADAAVGAYERAAEAYVEAGLHNNAIALCNKILRTDPERTDTYLRLGQISAKQGFLTDARANILLYAERASRAGRVEDALDALKEFASLAPKDVEIRLQLAEQLEAYGRDEEALEQLHLAFGAACSSGRTELEGEVRERILTLDPDADLATLEAELPGPAAPVDEGDGAEAEGFVLLPTFELGAEGVGSAAEATSAEPEMIELVPTAHVEEPIEAGLALQEISHLEGLEPTHEVGPEPEVVERLVDEPEEVEPLAPLPLLDDAMEMLDPGSVLLPEPDAEPAMELPMLAGDLVAEESDAGAEPLPLIPTWGALDDALASSEPVEPEMPEASAHSSPPAAVGGEEYVDLASLIFGLDEPETTTRFVVAEEEPSGDEDRDFAEMLARFRKKVDENIATDDSASHYDLGLAFKDMGLLDEAIAQFQVALRGGASPLATLEVLGECFVEKSQYTLASRVLERALGLPGAADGALIGVFYLYARAEEELGNRERAIEFYERVLSLDIRFRDARSRLAELHRSAPPAAF